MRRERPTAPGRTTSWRGEATAPPQLVKRAASLGARNDHPSSRFTRQHQRHGQPPLFALGAALPALRLPRNTWFFNGAKHKASIPSASPAHFATAQRRRAGLPVTQTSSQILLNDEDLNGAFEKVCGVVPEVLPLRRRPVLVVAWNRTALRGREGNNKPASSHRIDANTARSTEGAKASGMESRLQLRSSPLMRVLTSPAWISPSMEAWRRSSTRVQINGGPAVGGLMTSASTSDARGVCESSSGGLDRRVSRCYSRPSHRKMVPSKDRERFVAGLRCQ